MKPPRFPGPAAAIHLLPLLAAAALYAPTLGYDLTFDDFAHMDRPGVAETRTLGQVWLEPSLFYRPLVSTTFWLETRAGLPLWLRHGTNVALHAGVTLLVVRFALALGLAGWLACMVGILFAVHPVHVEAVAGLVGRADVLAALWLLLALGLHDRALRSNSWRRELLPGILLAFLAANTKESTWGLPAFALVLHAVRGRSPRPFWPLFAGYCLGIGGHLVLRRQVLGAWLTSPRGELSDVDNPLVLLDGAARILGGLKVGGLHLAHLVFPVTLSPDYSGPQIDVAVGPGDPWVWAGLLLVLGPAILLVRAARGRRAGDRALTAGAGWLWISAFMTMNLVYTIETVLADRLLYWPSIAWVLLLGGAGASLLDAPRTPARRFGVRDPRTVGMAGVLVVLAAGYAIRAADYLPLWQNNQALFEASVRIAPRVPRVWYNYGFGLHHEGRLDEAIAAYRRSRELQPTLQEAWAQEATALMQSDRWGEARGLLDEALRLYPEDVISRVNSGVYWLHADSVSLAAEEFRTALREDSTYAEAWYNLALAMQELGRDDEVEHALRKLLERNPGDAEAMTLLAEALFRQGRTPEAAETAREALRIEDTPERRERLEPIRSPDGETAPGPASGSGASPPPSP